VVIASNRGPLSFRRVGDRIEGARGGGGLVSGLAPLVESGRATWIAAALGDADREAAAGGVAAAAGLSARLLDLPQQDFDDFYDTVSNSTLWFLHHGLFDQVREPAYDDRWWEAWDAYRRVNHAFAEAVAEHAPRDAVVLVQDYHLTLLAPLLREQRGDLRLVHFHHTPFAGPDGSRLLAPAARHELLAGLAAHHACGFHIPTWARLYASTQRHLGGRQVTGFTSTLSSDPDALREAADSPECAAALAELEATLGDRLLVGRIDRMELSKNIVRGFAAWDLLLGRRPDLRGRATFVACCYPSRLGVPAYATYRDEVLAAADAVNRRWGDADWQPVVLLTDDDYPRSVAVMRRYDVLLVNPIRDGLNLVAKEGPLLNHHDGQLVLSTEAGAWHELSPAADGVFPFDVAATSVAIEAALDRPGAERAAVARRLAELASARRPADWLADQLRAGRDAGVPIG
jgi:trehalose 6-phosphate synthase